MSLSDAFRPRRLADMDADEFLRHGFDSDGSEREDNRGDDTTQNSEPSTQKYILTYLSSG